GRARRAPRSNWSRMLPTRQPSPACPAISLGSRRLDSRHGREIAEQLADRLAHFLAMHDHVDQAMFLEKFRGLESLRQILVCCFLDHARAGETDHAFRFSNNDVA